MSIKSGITKDAFVDVYENNKNYISKHKNDNMLTIALLSNKYFKTLTLKELMTLANHSEKFVGDAVLYRVENILGKKTDVEKMMSTKNKLITYLNKLDKNKSQTLHIISSFDYIKRHFPQMLPKGQKIMKTNGSEPTYRTELWRAQIDLLKNNNCYAYALNEKKTKRHHKRQPGNLYKLRQKLKEELFNIESRTNSNCSQFTKKILKDLKPWGGYLLNYNERTQECQIPEKGYYRIALVVSESDSQNLRDFHFYRQNKNGLWSHKRGWFSAPLAVDSSNKLIVNPALADRDYKTLNYNVFCAFFACPIVMV